MNLIMRLCNGLGVRVVGGMWVGWGDVGGWGDGGGVLGMGGRTISTRQSAAMLAADSCVANVADQ